MKTASLDITHEMTIDQLDEFFSAIFKRKGTFTMVLNRIGCPPAMNHIRELRRVLEKHQDSTKNFLLSTTIYTKSQLIQILIQATVALLRPEKPVHVVVGRPK